MTLLASRQIGMLSRIAHRAIHDYIFTGLVSDHFFGDKVLSIVVDFIDFLENTNVIGQVDLDAFLFTYKSIGDTSFRRTTTTSHQNMTTRQHFHTV